MPTSLHFFARHGIVGINSGLRLAPDAVYPEATRDIAKIVQWMRDNAQELGIDPEAHLPDGAFGRRCACRQLRL